MPNGYAPTAGWIDARKSHAGFPGDAQGFLDLAPPWPLESTFLQQRIGSEGPGRVADPQLV